MTKVLASTWLVPLALIYFSTTTDAQTRARSRLLTPLLTPSNATNNRPCVAQSSGSTPQSVSDRTSPVTR